MKRNQQQRTAYALRRMTRAGDRVILGKDAATAGRWMLMWAMAAEVIDRESVYCARHYWRRL